MQAERKERDARRKAWELENAPDPFEKEVRSAPNVACDKAKCDGSWFRNFIVPNYANKPKPKC